MIETQAYKQALRSFLQAINDSCDGVEIIAMPPELAITTQCHSALKIGELLVPIKHHSLTGDHEYYDVAFKGHHRVFPIHWLDEIINQLRFIGIDADYDLFAKRVRQSIEVIKRTLYKRRFQLHAQYSAKQLSFQEAEELVIFGHPSHPYPKLREGFSTEELEQFSPEFAGSFSLQWLAVTAEVLELHFSDETPLQAIAQLDGLSPISGHTLIPMHPWQWSKLKKIAWVEDYLQQRKIVEIEAPKSHKWSATTSVRTLYSMNSPAMLKFSMDVRITNSIRHLQVNEVVRGIQFIDVINTKSGQDFLKRFPSFHILLEPGYGGIRNPQGKIEPASIFTWRENPFSADHVNECINLCALTQPSPFDAGNLLLRRIPNFKENILEWFAGYLEVVLKPFIVAAGDYGFYFGAHQQNIVIKLDNNGLPNEVYFRDCQGTGYETKAYQDLISNHVSNGNDLPSEIANKLIGYYLIVNSTFGVISALARTNLVSEKELIVILKDFLTSFSSLKDKSFIEYLLHSEFIFKKNNFICSLENHNENTIADPFKLYSKIKNPIYAAR